MWSKNLSLRNPHPELVPLAYNVSVALPCILEHAQGIYSYLLQAYLSTQEAPVHAGPVWVYLNVPTFW